MWSVFALNEEIWSKGACQPRAAGQRVLGAGPAWLALRGWPCAAELRSSEQLSSPAIPNVGASVPPRLHLRFTLNLMWFRACFPIVTTVVGPTCRCEEQINPAHQAISSVPSQVYSVFEGKGGHSLSEVLSCCALLGDGSVNTILWLSRVLPGPASVLLATGPKKSHSQL